MYKRILIVDDEEKITSALSVLFRSAGYPVLTAHSGTEALKQLTGGLPSLVVLDIMMPGLDGYEVCRQIRGRTRYVPIIMLTAKDESWEKVIGLEVGADVYMTKPFEPGELLAQAKALLRLAEQTDGFFVERPLICGPLRLYPQQHQAILNDEEISLTPKEFELLHFLMCRPGQVFGRETLLRQVWGYEYVGTTRTVDVHVQRLRSKLGSGEDAAQLLDTVRGFGYRLALPK